MADFDFAPSDSSIVAGGLGSAFTQGVDAFFKAQSASRADAQLLESIRARKAQEDFKRQEISLATQNLESLMEDRAFDNFIKGSEEKRARDAARQAAEAAEWERQRQALVDEKETQVRKLEAERGVASGERDQQRIDLSIQRLKGELIKDQATFKLATFDRLMAFKKANRLDREAQMEMGRQLMNDAQQVLATVMDEDDLQDLTPEQFNEQTWAIAKARMENLGVNLRVASAMGVPSQGPMDGGSVQDSIKALDELHKSLPEHKKRSYNKALETHRARIVQEREQKEAIQTEMFGMTADTARALGDNEAGDTIDRASSSIAETLNSKDISPRTKEQLGGLAGMVGRTGQSIADFLSQKVIDPTVQASVAAGRAALGEGARSEFGKRPVDPKLGAGFGVFNPIRHLTLGQAKTRVPIEISQVLTAPQKAKEAEEQRRLEELENKLFPTKPADSAMLPADFPPSRDVKGEGPGPFVAEPTSIPAPPKGEKLEVKGKDGEKREVPLDRLTRIANDQRTLGQLAKFKPSAKRVQADFEDEMELYASQIPTMSEPTKRAVKRFFLSLFTGYGGKEDEARRKEIEEAFR